MKKIFQFMFLLLAIPYLSAQTETTLFGDRYHGKADSIISQQKIKSMTQYTSATDSAQKYLFRQMRYNSLGQLTHFYEYGKDGIHKIYQEEHLYDKNAQLIQTIAIGYPAHPEYKGFIDIVDDYGQFVRSHRLNPKKELVFKIHYFKNKKGHLAARRYYFDNTFCDSIGLTHFTEQPSIDIGRLGQVSVQFEAPYFDKTTSMDKEGNRIITLRHKTDTLFFVLKYYGEQIPTQAWVGRLVSINYFNNALQTFHYDEFGKLRHILNKTSSLVSNAEYMQYSPEKGLSLNEESMNILWIKEDGTRDLIVRIFYPYDKVAKESHYIGAGAQWLPQDETHYSQEGLIQKITYFLKNKKLIVYNEYEYFN